MDGERSTPLLAASRPLSDGDVASRTVRKLDRRFLVLLVGFVFVAYINRGNIAYAAHDLCSKLHLSHEEYGRGVSLFYVGYIPLQAVGNVFLKRFGAPAWISFIAFSWGCIATAMGFLQNTLHFYVLRMLLGLAQGGAFPAIWYTISLLYPSDHVTAAYGAIAFAVFFSMPVSSPIAAGLLTLGGYVGLERWRLLFIVEGLVPIVYALVLYAFLPISLEAVCFLDAAEKHWILLKQGSEERISGLSFWQEAKIAFADRIWRICTFCGVIDFGILSCLVFWATLILHDMLNGEDDDGSKDSETCGSKNENAVFAVLLGAIPFLIAGLLCLLQRRYNIRDRSRFSAISYGVAGMSLIAWSGTPSTWFVPKFLLLTCAITGSALSFAQVAGLMMTSSEVAVRPTAASLFNSISSVGAVLLPLVFGKLMDVAGPEAAVALSGVSYLIISLLIFCVSDPFNQDRPKQIDTEQDLDERC